MNPYMGDCGYSLRFFSVAFSAVFVALLLCHALRPKLSVRRFLFVVCLICWLGWAFGEVWWFHGSFSRYGSIITRIEASTAFQTYALSARSLLLYALLLSVAVGILYLFERVRFRRVAV
jgi:glucose uptake protein GlcU